MQRINVASRGRAGFSQPQSDSEVCPGSSTESTQVSQDFGGGYGPSLEQATLLVTGYVLLQSQGRKEARLGWTEPREAWLRSVIS